MSIQTSKEEWSRGLAHFEKREFDEAIADYDRATRINPDLAIAYLDRGCARYARGDIQGAVVDWSRTIQIDPHLAGAYNNRGANRTELGDVEGGLLDLDKAIALAPRMFGKVVPYWERRDGQNPLACSGMKTQHTRLAG